jgi:hypothetical protein
MKRSLRLALTSLIISIPLACKAESICPWLNQATASGLVGKEMNQPEVSGVPPNTTCAFHSQKGGEITDLAIQVIQMNDFQKEYGAYKGKCGVDKSALRAIGNEADMCPVDTLPGTRGERVIGRVRDRAYIITVSTSGRFKPSFNRDTMESQARAVAEQVAGILF